MKRYLSDRLRRVKGRAALALLLLAAEGRGQQPPPPPAAVDRSPPASVALPSAKAREPEPEADAIKVRIDGEYEARQSFLTNLPLVAVGDAPAALEQTSRLFHWLRLRGLSLFGTMLELRGEIDVPRGMVYGVEPQAVPDSGTDFERLQPIRVHPRMLRATLRGRWGEITVGHTTNQWGIGLLDADGDQPRVFGTPDRPASYERLALLSGGSSSPLRIGLAGDLLFDDGRLSLADGDQQYRVGLSAQYRPTRAVELGVLARYQALRARGSSGGAQLFDFDLTGSVRQRLRGRPAELFCEYEGVYRVGNVNEPTAFASGPEQSVLALSFAARAGVALERSQQGRRYAHVVASVEWGMTSGDADPTDDELHRFVMNPNHGVGLILFSEILRFKTSRAQAALDARAEQVGSRSERLATRGGVAGASYLNPVLMLRPLPDLTLKLGGVVATATTIVVDPGALAARGERTNFDGGSPRGRSLGSELDVGAELQIPLEPPMQLRLSIEGAMAFPGSAFDDEAGDGLGTQALTTAGLGLTF
jgi:hypothetical protein